MKISLELLSIIILLIGLGFMASSSIGTAYTYPNLSPPTSVFFGKLAKELGISNAIYYRYLFYKKDQIWEFDSGILGISDKKYYKKFSKMPPEDYYFTELTNFNGCIPDNIQYYRFQFFNKDKKLIYDSLPKEIIGNQ